MCPEELKFEAKKYLDVLNSTCVFGLVPFKPVWSSGWVGGGGGGEGGGINKNKASWIEPCKVGWRGNFINFLQLINK